MMTWMWAYVAFVVGLYALLIALRISHDRREAVRTARRAQMWAELKASGYPHPPPTPKPPPPRQRWFDTDGVEIFED